MLHCTPCPYSRAAVSRPQQLQLARTIRPVPRVRTKAATLDKTSQTDWAKLAEEMDRASPLEIMDHALATFGNDVGIAFSGAEDVAMVEYAPHGWVVTHATCSLDTGRLNPETYQLFDQVEKHYGIRIEYTFPDAQETMDLVRAKGLFSFYQDGHQECCRVRKVKPLRRQLKNYRAWITGQRKDQSPGTRMAVPVVQADPVFEGMDGPNTLVKYNPMSNLTSQEVWNFIRTMGVPYNKLHERGYVSIGCEPCTRPVLPNQPEREGRWWWEDAAAKECGLHSGNVQKNEDGSTMNQVVDRDLWVDGAVEALSPQQMRDIAAGNRDRGTLAVLYAPWCQFCQALEPEYAALAQSMAGSQVRIAKYQADTDREYANANLGLKTFPSIVYYPKGRSGYIKYPSERRDLQTLQMWVRTVAGFV
ncbi:5'-adenylylsulfate reductase [Dunaliella salina]|uniref:5'-adenylylsulfate reductase n=1 Tax=Dunaliella salina TaxID=3046 RepID=A0ABQ7GU09_DUNSA|nr:5'-adenylylsulfate reductase [Dunaliella salina]|eukprot:KAF5838025.1 5'-adenylylsulfate reductase [Dunaliella salina]